MHRRAVIHREGIRGQPSLFTSFARLLLIQYIYLSNLLILGREGEAVDAVGTLLVLMKSPGDGHVVPV